MATSVYLLKPWVKNINPILSCKSSFADTYVSVYSLWEIMQQGTCSDTCQVALRLVTYVTSLIRVLWILLISFSLILEQYENQRFDGTGWVSSKLPIPVWSDKTGGICLDKDSFKLPNGWKWSGDWQVASECRWFSGNFTAALVVTVQITFPDIIEIEVSFLRKWPFRKSTRCREQYLENNTYENLSLIDPVNKHFVKSYCFMCWSFFI